MAPLRIAVVGSGVSGLAATWLLNEHSDHVVELFEADARPGGHANTITFKPPENSGLLPCEVDTGFIVTNPATYPNFLRFLKLKRVPTVETQMTFSISRDGGLFEWAGTPDPRTLFCQPRNLLRPTMWRMIWDVLRFNACALAVLEPGCPDAELSIGEYLERNGYSDAFRDDYLLPMTAAIWSTPPDKCALGFPARTLVRFMANHHLLQVIGKPPWLTIPGGSHRYVRKILECLPAGHFHLNCAVQSVVQTPDGKLMLTASDGVSREFDRVILATHSDITLRILGDGATAEERDVLGKVGWNMNEAVLHHDPELMPKSRKAWAAWNYLTFSTKRKDGTQVANVDRVALTYGMNTLQHLKEDRHGPVLVTLNPPFEPKPETVLGRWKYDHPVLDTNAVEAQALLPTIQNARGIAFAGAWTKYGFHEDGFTSGLRAALAVVPSSSPIRLPFEVESAERVHVHAVWLAEWFDWVRVSGVGAWVEAFVVMLCALLSGVFLNEQK